MQQAHATRVSFVPTLRGLFDVHGNAFEWCHDWYGRYATEGEATGPSEGSDRVLRGGSWVNTPQYCRSADRHGCTPSNRNTNFGFRVLRSSVQSSQE